MIVSASYRSDIPAFHAARFRRQLAQGFATVKNPYGGPDYRVSLAPEDVDGFIFWTRNARPFRDGLTEAGRIAPFVIQYTVTGYPETLERGVPPADHAIAEIARIAAEQGPGRVVWRYDPVIWTGLTGADFHRDNFRRLADRLAGQVDEVTFSAATLYAKSKRNLKRHAPAVDVSDPDDDAKRALLADLAGAAAERGLRPTLCSQPHLLSEPMTAAKCVDAGRLQRIGSASFRSKQKGNRPGCDCAESRDIGAYDSCAHGCLYCYAVNDHEKAKAAVGGRAPLNRHPR
ncbi:MAG: DUF1848 family protein [Minwuia sp.]|uniref:DUF1848 family protein n=1 Tax=Minwuia sp. TaxID=2493630 RepID=UPI003A8B6296